jgi:hypothetical protein
MKLQISCPPIETIASYFSGTPLRKFNSVRSGPERWEASGDTQNPGPHLVHFLYSYHDSKEATVIRLSKCAHVKQNSSAVSFRSISLAAHKCEKLTLVRLNADFTARSAHFRPLLARRRSHFRIVFALSILILSAVTISHAIELRAPTLDAWNAYVRSVTSSMEQRAKGDHPYLWVDESADLKKRVLGGEVVVVSQDHSKISNGLVHHWLGAIFFPGATLDQVNVVLDDYDHYKDMYAPMIAKSKLLDRTDQREKVNLLLVGKAVGVIGAVDTDDEVQIVKVDADKCYTVSNSVRAQEISDYGKPSEHLLPQDQGPGYVWRTFGITRLMQRDGGVYLEMETVSLSRGIPWEFRWLVAPVTEHLPRMVMTQTLIDTREAVKKVAKPASAQE